MVLYKDCKLYCGNILLWRYWLRGPTAIEIRFSGKIWNLLGSNALEEPTMWLKPLVGYEEEKLTIGNISNYQPTSPRNPLNVK